MAGRVVKTLPDLQAVLQKHGIETRIAIAAGDFEGFDERTLSRLKETREGFAHKLRVSQQKILDRLGRDTETIMIAEAAGGKDIWNALTAQAQQRLAIGDNGCIVDNDLDYAAILNASWRL